MDATLFLCTDDARRSRYARWLADEGYSVVETDSVADALDRHRTTEFPLTVAELAPPELDGVELVRAVRSLRPLARFLVLSPLERLQAAIAAMKEGASDLLVEPFTQRSLVDSVRGLCPAEADADSARRLEEEVRRHDGFADIVTRSPRMLQVLALAARVAELDTTVLITGESGTGKERLACALHRISPRRDHRMVSINCAAIPETLLESELFGYRKGAFTGADADKEGLIAAAHGGTLFLDEVAELPLILQAKLLRFLEEGTYFPVGAVNARQADVRVIAATNAQLVERVEDGTFRRDLYYRLAVFPLHLPPLRERPEDIVPLAQYFLDEIRRVRGGGPCGLSREVVHYLTACDWPGNARELRNAVERALILSEGGLLSSADFRRLEPDPAVLAAAGAAPLYHLPPDGVSLPALDRLLIEQAMQRANHNISAAARLVGLSRAALRYRLKKYRLPRAAAEDGPYEPR